MQAKASTHSKFIAKAFDYCLFLTKNHYENFPVASLAIPQNLRPPIAAIYAFARTADDFADEQEYENLRMDFLNNWEQQLKTMMQVTPTHPIFIALRQTILRFKIPLSLFFDLINAFKMDVVINRFDTFVQLLNYCSYSANPVGRIILHIMGYPAPKFMEYSDKICTALQLANFWQDVDVDLKKNRIYFPKEDMQRFGVTEKDLVEKTYTPNFKRLLTFQIHRTKFFFDQGKVLCEKIPGRFGFELRLTWIGGTTILKKILKNQCNIFQKRPTLSKIDFFKIFFKAMNKKTFTQVL